jgi:class 3 adenylate cyclase
MHPKTERYVDLGRRHVAVLFADLSGFTALVESARPETVYRRVRPLMDELVALVETHGGEIQQVLGDGFMAVFGLDPADRGDEVARAVRAGLALLATGGHAEDALPVHVGIESGDVLVSPSWEPARFAVWGRAVTVAKRLCDLAGGGTMHVGPHAFEGGARAVLAGAQVGPATPVAAKLRGIVGEVVLHRVTCRAAGCRCLRNEDAAPGRRIGAAVGRGRPRRTGAGARGREAAARRLTGGHSRRTVPGSR